MHKTQVPFTGNFQSLDRFLANAAVGIWKELRHNASKQCQEHQHQCMVTFSSATTTPRRPFTLLPTCISTPRPLLRSRSSWWPCFRTLQAPTLSVLLRKGFPEDYRRHDQGCRSSVLRTYAHGSPRCHADCSSDLHSSSRFLRYGEQ